MKQFELLVNDPILAIVLLCFMLNLIGFVLARQAPKIALATVYASVIIATASFAVFMFTIWEDIHGIH